MIDALQISFVHYKKIIIVIWNKIIRFYSTINKFATKLTCLMSKNTKKKINFNAHDMEDFYINMYFYFL